MPHRTISMSFRLSEQESEILARMQVPGATTPSEKLRGLIHNSPGQLDQLPPTQQLRKVLEDVRARLDASDERSDFLSSLVDRLPLLVGTLTGKAADTSVKDLEAAVLHEVYELAEQCRRCLTSPHANQLNPDLVKEYQQRFFSNNTSSAL
ncbi:hypothetical protein [Flexibacterium corallicola]|uniref:hypothetical protein n=1 Tax=Flexibacterium corallicola TaxID=3037259 RepID=UPI00286F771B|nr:hypothetical protein [Pseudovibrio sp. M1P-2-3]